MIQSMRRTLCTALRQRLGRIPYAPASKVAMQRQDIRPVIWLQCVANHRGTLKPAFSRYLLRYLARSLSIADGLLGNLTVHFRQCSFPCCLTRRQIRQQHQANTPPIGSSASSAFAVMSVSLVAQLRPETGVFLTARHEINTQPRSPAAGFIPCCTAVGGCHA